MVLIIGGLAFNRKPAPQKKPVRPPAAAQTNKQDWGSQAAAALAALPRKPAAVATNAVQAAEKGPMSDDERKAREMRELLDSGDETKALRMARTLMHSPEDYVRSEVVTVIGWIGLKALPELTQMLGDKDEGIASEALSHWQTAVGEVEGEQDKADLLVAAITTMRKQEDMESLAMTFTQLPDALVVRSLVKILQIDNEAASEMARQQYEFVTQTPYTTPAAAEKWARENAEENTATP
jgi:hypothetical protein